MEQKKKLVKGVRHELQEQILKTNVLRVYEIKNSAAKRYNDDLMQMQELKDLLVTKTKQLVDNENRLRQTLHEGDLLNK